MESDKSVSLEIDFLQDLLSRMMRKNNLFLTEKHGFIVFFLIVSQVGGIFGVQIKNKGAYHYAPLFFRGKKSKNVPLYILSQSPLV